MREALFVGEPGVYSVYHPCTDPFSDKLLVIFMPLFGEYQRLYRSCYELAEAVSQSGYHCIRFDYPGTGDSQMELNEVNALSTWVNAAKDVIDEATALSGANHISVFAIRGGAIVSSLLSDIVDEFYFWDPLLNGADVIKGLEVADQEIYASLQKGARYACSALDTDRADLFVVSEEFKSDIASTSLDAPNKAKILVSDEKHGRYSEEKEVPTNYSYDWPAYQDGLLKPRPVLETLLTLLK